MSRRRSASASRLPPVLIAKIGRYPLHHGAVAAIRSLGRLGVPVYAVTEGRFTPVSLSRYVTASLRWPTTGMEPLDALLAGLRRAGQWLGRPAVALATDDEAAILLAAHRDELADLFLLPAVDPALPAQLADKQDLFALCRAHGAPAPHTAIVEKAADLAATAAQFGFPLIAKNRAPFERLLNPIVGGTTLLRGEADVIALAEILDRCGGQVLLQEYLPPSDGSFPSRAVNWFAHVYCFRDDRPPLVFTGMKLRSWPPGAGVTTRGIAVAEPQLAAATAEFCRAIGYRGIGDLDWRLDPRDGLFKLVDFNPRTGAQFQLFRTTSGVDVVRAQYLDLIGRQVPDGCQIDGRELIVEHLDTVSRIAGRVLGREEPVHPRPVRREPAWFAWDDPLPFAVATVRFGGYFAQRVAKLAELLRRPGPVSW
jgi:predicted ATP-grasp superfamily ATP-dependent carboligase